MTNPHPLLLEAQGRVCTGPHQSRPLGAKVNDPIQPTEILQCILDSLANPHAPERASMAQMGAFFTAMSIRRQFGAKTGWCEAERKAFAEYTSQLESSLPAPLLFLWQPQRGYTSQNESERHLVSLLTRILDGQHLSYEETLHALQYIQEPSCHDAFRAAVLIGQRMNIENDDEVKAYLDVVYPPSEIQTLDIPSLTHFGEPYNGAKRYVRSRLFLAAIHASLGRPVLLHGVETLPPKFGITEEQILHELGAKTDNTLSQTAQWLKDPSLGFAYVSQRTFSPKSYGLAQLRYHIKKRPPFATTEKAQQIFRSKHTNAMVIGFYHSGYEQKLLDLMWERGFDAGLTIKGQEGTSIYSLRSPTPSAEKKTLNYTAGFRRQDGQRISFQFDMDPATYGLSHPYNPRLEPSTVQETVRRSLEAIRGTKGEEYDRLVLTAALTDHFLGFSKDPEHSIQEVKQVIDSGEAAERLQRYIDATQQA